jgi:hypothetical protein
VQCSSSAHLNLKKAGAAAAAAAAA